MGMKFNLSEFEKIEPVVTEEEPKVVEKPKEESGKFTFEKPVKNNKICRKNFAVTEEDGKRFKEMATKYGMNENQFFNAIIHQLFEES